MLSEWRAILWPIATSGLTALTVWGIFTFFGGDGPYAPMGGYNNPQPIQNEGPFLTDGFIEVIAVKCNLSDEVITVRGRSEWQQLGGGAASIDHRQGEGEFFPAGYSLSDEDRARGWGDDGCRTTIFRNEFPVDDPEWGPGIWVLEGTNTANDGDKTQNVHWETEPFEVVP